MSPCRHRHTGYVTNQPSGYDRTRNLASVYVCDRPECRAKATRWVAGQTNETATFVPFPGRPTLDLDAPTEERGGPETYRDRQGDVWTPGPDGLLHSPETRPFPREHVERKWGPLVRIEEGRA